MAAAVLGESPQDGIDVGNIGDPRGVDSNRQPGRAGNDAKKDKRTRSVWVRQAWDKLQASHSAPNHKEHD